MIKEICQFMEDLTPEIREMIPKLKPGVHILLTEDEDSGQIIVKDFAFTKDETNGKGNFLKQCALFAHTAWMIDTNKCFDLPTKAIHSCSPYCLGLKKSSLTGETFNRVDDYFKKAINMFPNLKLPEVLINKFKEYINTNTKFENLLVSYDCDFQNLKDTDYIVVYLDVPFNIVEEYGKCYRRERLFNTSDYNIQVGEEIWGSSNFLNGFPTKKPFLLHQTAAFTVAGRISEKEAMQLDEFKSLMLVNILPRPLPLFIYSEERLSEMSLFSESLDAGKRIGYKEIIEDLIKKKKEIGNYYLVYFSDGTIKDFEFVSQFEYGLADGPWEVVDYFKIQPERKSIRLTHIFDFEKQILPILFENSLVVRTKEGEYRYKYFEDIDSKYCASEQILSLILKYRRACYEYVYKSKRGSITRRMMEDILYTGILDDIRRDEKREKHFGICGKLNIAFSLLEKFDRKHNNQDTMGSNLLKHRAFIMELREGNQSVESDDQYAFVVGQILYYLLDKSKTADTSYKRLESFLRQTQVEKLNLAIATLFDHYKHENYSRYFRRVFAEIMDYTSNVNLKNKMPILLAGFFSDNQLYAEKKQNKEELTTEIIEEN